MENISNAIQAARKRPLFGQLAQEVLGLSAKNIEDCLKYQQHAGGRLGEILLNRGLLTRAQIGHVISLQARWAAKSITTHRTFPHPVFLSLCLPAFNEEANIEDTLDAACSILPEFVQRFEIIVVDDGSRDNTADIVRRYAQRDSHVRLEQHPQNRGYGAAVTTGLRASCGEMIAFTDSDGQFSLLDLPHFLRLMEGRDVVIGYRYRRADPLSRLINAWCWKQLIHLLLGVRVRDLDCAFKLFRRNIVDNLYLTKNGATINAEIMAQCFNASLRIAETPVLHYPRYHGAPTGANFHVICKAFKELPSLLKYRNMPAANALLGTVNKTVGTAR